MKSFYFKTFMRFVLIVILSAVAIQLYNAHLLYSLFLICIFIFGLLFELYLFQKKHYSTIDRIVLSMIYNDYSLNITNTVSNETIDNLNRLYQKLQNEQQQNDVRELIYLNLFNSIETGILIIEKKDDKRNIFLMNDYFSKLFDIPKVESWTNLERLLPGLAHHLNQLNLRDHKAPIDIQINKDEKQTFILQSSSAVSQNNEYYIILLDSIQHVLDKKEQNTWTNLMKVISHELMNSLTPIHSLADNIQHILAEDNLTDEDMEDITLSIKTIVNRTNHLQQFINNYRKLTMLSSPRRQKVDVSNVLNDTIDILTPLFNSNQIKIQTYLEPRITQDWDPKQMEQVFINLLTNAMHAVNKQEDKEIKISLYAENNRIHIDIQDNGPGILPEIVDKIFIPFYTTREEGAGIGLPLSKNIVEMHNGYLTYKQKEGKTTFCLNFPID